MPKQSREDIEDVTNQLIEALKSDTERPDEAARAMGIAGVRMASSVVINLGRLADAAERIAQALEDESKIHEPQIENIIEQQEPATCPVCEREGVTFFFCGKVDCPKAPF